MLTKEEAAQFNKQICTNDSATWATLFGMLSDTTRLNILKLLTVRPHLCVTELATITETSVSAMSHQLRLLEMVDLVEKNRKGQTMCYTINDKHPFIRTFQEIIT